jgi:hypothetical protein
VSRTLLTFASVCTFLLLVLAAAALSLLDLLLTDDPGRSWEASHAFVRRWLWVADDPGTSEEERRAPRCRVTCTEVDGTVRELLLTGAHVGEVLEWHLQGFRKLELEAAADEEGPDSDLSREWE